MRLLGFVLLIASAAFGGEYAVFTSGVRMHVDRHEIDGTRIRLYCGEGYTEMPVKEVRRFEVEDPGETVAVAAPASKVEVAPLIDAGNKIAGGTPEELADAAADKYHLPRALVRSVMKAESGFQLQALSPKGAIGLMQLMPETANDLGADPYDPAQNVDAGVRYLRDLLVKNHGWLWHALAAYNAGPGAVDKYNGIPPYPETINYINRVVKQAGQSAGQQ
jgi:soluble lytic murein transglycosylase-like protein